MPRRTVVDPRFADRLRELRADRRLSIRDLAALSFLAKSTVSDLENQTKAPTPETARTLDKALGTGGELTAMVSEAPSDQPYLWETAELLERVRASAVSPAAIEALHLTAFELCCRYGRDDPLILRGEGHRWLREVMRLLRRPVGLHEHRELLTIAGWLALLVGCVEYDLGLAPAAEATRGAAVVLGREGGNGEIEAWGWEMAAWFALTQGRYRDVVTAAETGQTVVGRHTAAVQLVAQEAKARARQGDPRGVRAALVRGRRLLDLFAPPSRPDHHFVVDPEKWDFYAMDAYRLVGDDTRAQHHAEQVLRQGTAEDGSERAPMRMAEARLTLGVVAARAGDLEAAVAAGLAAFHARRRSIPQLLLVAAELDAELQRRDPKGPWSGEFRNALRAVRPPAADT